MPTSYTDQFYLFDPANPPAVGSAVSFSVLSMTDENDDDDLDRFDNDSVDGSDITASWPGDTVTINVPGVGNVTYTGITFYLADGQRVFTPTDGQVLQDGTFVSSTFVNTQGSVDVDDLGPPCFTKGTLIKTSRGEIPVEEIEVGDLVETLDKGAQEIRWVGRRSVEGSGVFAPVKIKTGTVGNNREILVSQQHRILLSGWRCEIQFGYSEMLAAAKYLVDDSAITIEHVDEIEYFHFLFNEHEIVWAEGMLCESFNPCGCYARENRQVAAELHAIFPELSSEKSVSGKTARPILRAFEANLASQFNA
ncbi:MAG: Hint domain-containing protein [Boseongicola sp.]